MRANRWRDHPIEDALGSDGETGTVIGGGGRMGRSGLSCRPAMGYRPGMDDERVNGRIEEAVLALLYLGIFESHPAGGARAWKSLDWDAMGRLHEKGLISDPTGKAKSVVLTEAGLREAEAAFLRLFEADD